MPLATGDNLRRYEVLCHLTHRPTRRAKGDTFAAEKFRVWTEAGMRNNGRVSYDVAPDGKRLRALQRKAPTGR
jgi:hypothetical protein